MAQPMQDPKQESQEQYDMLPVDALGRPPEAGPLGPAAMVPPPPQGGAEGLVLSMIGAALGALLGAGLWFAIAYVTQYEIGYVAILVGALAGWGAVWVGKQRNATVGLIAALFGAAAILGGSYASFRAILHSQKGKAVFQAAFEKEAMKNPEFVAKPAAERQEIVDALYKEHVLDKITYLGAMQEDPKSLAFMVLFGALGLYYGYRVGSGASGKKEAA